MTLKHLLFAITLLSISLNNHAQTTLGPGDIAIIGMKTNNNSDSGNDAAKLLVLVPLDCNTKFIVTDNNWRNNGTWYCDNDEFAIELTVTSPINAGTVIYLDLDGATNATSSSTGSLSRAGLGSTWGTNYGLNSKGDNLFVLQGTRLSPSFIFGVRHDGAYSLGGDCSSATSGSSPKNNTAIPAALSLGTSALELNSAENQWHYDCSKTISGDKATLLSSICNGSNWTKSSGQSWNSSTCNFTVTGAGGTYTSCGVFLSNGDFILKSSCKNDENELQWYTLNESSNFKQLTLESSTSEDNFEGIYTLKTSIESNKIYSYKHSNGKKATYYRLRYIDENGFTKYSDVVAASCKNANEFSIYPNPAKNSVNVTISYLEKGSDASLIVYNVLGEIVYLTTINSPQQVIINSERFSSGIYYLVLSTEKDKQTQKLVISNN